MEIQARALNLLARREHSRSEMRYKLRKRFDANALIETVLDNLIREGWLSEARFVEVYIRSRASAGFGPAHIRQALLQRGIGESLIEEFLFSLPDIDWQERAQAVRVKKFGQVEPTDYIDRMKQLKFLQYRGF